MCRFSKLIFISLALMVSLFLRAIHLWCDEPREPQERKKLAGIWKGYAVEGAGENSDRGPVKLELRISETQIHGLEFKGDKTIDHGKGAYTFDLSKSPRILDASRVNEFGRKEQYLGIYALEGDTLKWCVTRKKNRPTEFRTGEGAFLVIVKKSKP